MLKVIPTKQFKKDVRQLKKSGTKDISKLTEVIKQLSRQEPLPYKFRDHKLKGDMNRFRECHIEPDWLLVYEVKEDVLVLSLVRTGSHSEII